MQTIDEVKKHCRVVGVLQLPPAPVPGRGLAGDPGVSAVVSQKVSFSCVKLAAIPIPAIRG